MAPIKHDLNVLVKCTLFDTIGKYSLEEYLQWKDCWKPNKRGKQLKQNIAFGSKKAISAKAWNR